MNNNNEHKLILKGWWGKKSVLLDPNCFFHILKTKYVEKLLEKGLISNSDIDRRNETPHIAITNDEQTKNDQAYKNMDQKIIKLSSEIIEIEKDWISINTGNSGILDTHFTLIFKRGLKKQSEKFTNLLNETLIELNCFNIFNLSENGASIKSQDNSNENNSQKSQVDDRLRIEHDMCQEALELKDYGIRLDKLNGILKELKIIDKFICGEELVNVCNNILEQKKKKLENDDLLELLKKTKEEKNILTDKINKLEEILNIKHQTGNSIVTI